MHGVYLTIIVSISLFVYAIFSLRKVGTVAINTSVYYLYFVTGVAGWVFLWLTQNLTDNIFLSINAPAFYFSSILLFFATSNAHWRSASGFYAILLYIVAALLTLFFQDELTQLTVASLFTVIIYVSIAIICLKRERRSHNKGDGIIGIAAVIEALCGFIALLLLINQRDASNALGVLFIASSAGFIVVGIGFMTTIMISEHRKLALLSTRDPLTELFNRRGLDQSLALIVPSLKRNKQPLSAIAIDIDHFKALNDQYGHDGGDVVLIRIAQLMQSLARASDACCRLGGEEFIVLLPNTEHQEALAIAERLRAEIATLTVEFDKHIISFTASFGVATQYDDLQYEQLFKQADKALYMAKESGRNLVKSFN